MPAQAARPSQAVECNPCRFFLFQESILSEYMGSVPFSGDRTQAVIDAASLWEVVKALKTSKPNSDSPMERSTAVRTTALIVATPQLHVSPSPPPPRDAGAYPRCS